MPNTPKPASQRSTLVAVAGLNGYWANKTGGDTEADVSMVWDGGAKTPVPLAAPAATSNWVLTRPYYPARDQAIVRSLRAKVGAWTTTLSEQDTDADLQPIGKPNVAPDALLIAVRSPETDAGSGDAKTMELEFAVPRIV